MSVLLQYSGALIDARHHRVVLMRIQNVFEVIIVLAAIIKFCFDRLVV